MIGGSKSPPFLLFTKLLLCLHKTIIYYICMNIDKVLDNIIKILVSIIICIMLIIGFLFITPVSVHAVSNPDPLPVFSSAPSVADLISNGFVAGITNSGKTVYCGSSVSNTFVGYNGAGTAFGYLCETGGTVYRCFSDSSTVVTSSMSVNTSFDNMYYASINNGNNYFVTTANFYGYLYSNNSDFVNYVRSYSSSVGEFYTLPQVDSSEQIDYATIAASGANIYAEGNVYSYLGQYQTVQSPTSQFCYVQTGENAYTPVVFSSVPLTVYNAFINGQTYSYFVLTEYETGKYCYTVPTYATLDEVEPCVPFENLTSAKEAFSGASSSGAGSASGVVSAGAMTLNVPAGNVLYVRPRSGSMAKLTVVMPYKSSPYSPYWDRTQSNVYWLSGVSSLPDSNTTFPLSGMTNINWSLDETSVDGYGRGFNGYTNHAPFNAGWFVVYNPLYTLPISKGNDNSLSINPTVTVEMQYATEYYIYDLNERITSSGGNSSSLTDYETNEHGVYDPISDTTNTSSTLPNGEPVTGGQQQDTISTDLTFNDYFHIFTETLSEFANSVVNIFTAPISHIAQLISSGGTFMTYIGQFFTWLPEPVYQILVSALVVAVAVGVFKLLL